MSRRKFDDAWVKHLESHIQILEKALNVFKEMRDGKPQGEALQKYDINRSFYKSIYNILEYNYKDKDYPVEEEVLKPMQIPTLSGGERLYAVILKETQIDRIPYHAEKTMKEILKKDRLLSKREVQVLRMRFWEGCTLEFIGSKLGVQRERIRQIEENAIKKLSKDCIRRYAVNGTNFYQQKKMAALERELKNEEEWNKQLAELQEKINKMKGENLLIRNSIALTDKEELAMALKEGIVEKNFLAYTEKGEEIKVGDLNLSSRAYNCLMRRGITTVSTLTKLTFDDLIGIRNMGLKTATEIVEVLEGHGFYLKDGKGKDKTHYEECAYSKYFKKCIKEGCVDDEE